MKDPGELAIVLHTHMPYVEGFGTWPFGEEWLWEAIATSYLPLLDGVLGAAPLTLSLTPVLCDQLEAPGAVERCIRFLREIRPESHARDIAALHRQPDGQETGALIAELERSEAEYAAAAGRLEQPGTNLPSALGDHATWTSSATHAILPLIATDAGLALQLQTGIQSHRHRFGDWDGGLWLPECAYAPWLDVPLEEAGARASCIELTGRLGHGSAEQLHPIQTGDGPLLWPIDRATIDLVWGDAGYPSRGAYRDYHRMTEHHHRVWSVDGAPYDHARAQRQARDDARDFVERVRDRVAGGGVCVCALDTELLGHWWYEGVGWLAAVTEEAALQGLPMTTLDDARERHAAVPPPAGGLPVCSWGEGGDLRTWSGPASAELAWQARSAELETLAHSGAAGPRALRELLAVQSSDWAFLHARDLARPYATDRPAGHLAELRRALAGADGAGDPALRNLAPQLAGWEG